MEMQPGELEHLLGPELSEKTKDWADRHLCCMEEAVILLVARGLFMNETMSSGWPCAKPSDA